MLQDYEIKRTKTTVEKVIFYIEFALILIIIQSTILLLSGGTAEEEAIRFRLLANSNTPADQEMKKEIQREIAPLIEMAVAASQSSEELVDNLENLEQVILNKASAMSNGMSVTLEKTEALFPPKKSGFIVSPQATYDAYILTIGSGRGDNWWCALFPKVCFVDEKEDEEEKVTFFIWEWFKGLFSESY